jgi:hypothetical protein
VFHGFVAVPVGVWLSGRIGGGMGVLMMEVVHVRVGVFEGFVPMKMVVLFEEVEPDAHAHERCGAPEERGRKLPFDEEGKRGSKKRGD